MVSQFFGEALLYMVSSPYGHLRQEVGLYYSLLSQEDVLE